MQALRVLMWGVFGLLCVQAGVLANTDQPVFLQWLKTGDPGDETIRNYWERSQSGQLNAEETVDLGTMLFQRGYPKDAVRMYKKALDMDKNLYEAWYRIGLVKHSQGELYDARKAYKRCLKKLTGHGWCNFYLGLLEEQEGNSTDALYYFRRAFKFAPEISNPAVNPEMLNSQLAFAAKLREVDRVEFKNSLPMPYLDPAEVRQVNEQYEATPVPRQAPEKAVETVAEPTAEETATEPKSPVPIRTRVPSNDVSATSPPARPAPVRRAPATSSGSSGTTDTSRSSGTTGRSGSTVAPPSQTGGAPTRVPPIPNASPEARLDREWQGLWRLAAAMV
jgi:hypothetical protein